MAECGVHYPSVFVVDSHQAFPPPLPPRLGRKRPRVGAAQTLLLLLVSLALCGMVIEACFIYRLYNPEPADSASSAKIISDKGASTRRPNPVILPSKPVAHLTDGQSVRHGPEIMSWSTDADPLLYKMEYKQGKIVIQKEGYYYVYSKVFFMEGSAFSHSMHLETPRYLGGDIPLLQSRKYSHKPGKEAQSNSYLGGVFHLHKDDSIFVKVKNTSQIVRLQAYENFFGAYMI
ncbi:tumor necrosis factor ligand superfamily member 14 [Centroberyx gerrardi]|uniref:tumor necrosis factor ligand superfamily member 14-like n=1 Tax=Centroberyx gerrardi TaxID=166262 RepID=UPI003AAA8608